MKQFIKIAQKHPIFSRLFVTFRTIECKLLLTKGSIALINLHISRASFVIQKTRANLKALGFFVAG